MKRYIFLIGRHGTGKSTLGRASESENYKHVSVGVLRRLAGHNQYPVDIPYSLMRAFRTSPRGEPMSDSLATKLVGFLSSQPACVVDGFPSKPEHLRLLPINSVVVYVWCGQAEREHRLETRAMSSMRQWKPSGASFRDEALSNLAVAARRANLLMFHRNDGGVESIPRQIQQIIARAEAHIGLRT